MYQVLPIVAGIVIGLLVPRSIFSPHHRKWIYAFLGIAVAALATIVAGEKWFFIVIDPAAVFLAIGVTIYVVEYVSRKKHLRFRRRHSKMRFERKILLIQTKSESDSFDRRALMKVAAGGMVAGGLLSVGSNPGAEVQAAFVPNNFRAVIHVTSEEAMTYAFSSLQTIADHYKKATGRLILDGDAVKALSNQSVLDQLKSAKDAGAEIQAASNALEINGIDPTTLPDFIDSSMPGIIAVMEAHTKGYHYYKP